MSDVIIVGFDGNASAVDLILAGDLIKATVAQQPYEMGYQAVEAAVEVLNGGTVESVINAPVEVVTAENGQGLSGQPGFHAGLIPGWLRSLKSE